MKNSNSPSLSTLLFSAMLGALAVIIYRRLFKRPAPSVVPWQPLRIQMVKKSTGAVLAIPAPVAAVGLIQPSIIVASPPAGRFNGNVR